jgi:hypothetical protein
MQHQYPGGYIPYSNGYNQRPQQQQVMYLY